MGVYIHAAWLMDPSRAGTPALPLPPGQEFCSSWMVGRKEACCAPAVLQVHPLLLVKAVAGRHATCTLSWLLLICHAPADGMNRFIEYAMGHDNVWFATMSEVGRGAAGQDRTLQL